MYELWARRRKIEGKGFPYEYIFKFTNEEYKYTAIDKLDRNIYEEAMVIMGNDCIMYVELEQPYIYKLRR